MTARSRHLSGAFSPPPSSSPPTRDSTQTPVNSDFVLILAALLCALISVLGLVTVARCAWIRRIAGRTSTTTPAETPRSSAANKGLKKKVLKSLPSFKYGEDEKQPENHSDCAICLAEYAPGDEIRVLPQCGHGFHIECIDMWLGSHSSCPSCRQILAAPRCNKCGELPVSTDSGAPAEASGGHGDDRCEVAFFLEEEMAVLDLLQLLVVGLSHSSTSTLVGQSSLCVTDVDPPLPRSVFYAEIEHVAH
ncbi:hypothetical protein BUALT_Bualt08G0006900 [Buddleja alternifolia]|uniref:RING-type E3 ubiquitin transferase n=1 Tax=Buddleja alternifolia TaxID=168488 RepID=A0AAV6X9A7_9LAMI|nr:hypothetical protein BUALT_Bualt08G0006900 [Buddleja alternifolia]